MAVPLVCLAAFVAALAVSSAPAAPAGADLRIDIGVSKELNTQGFPIIPNGGTRTFEGLDFSAGFQVVLVNQEAGGAKIRFQLAEGLRWGADAPDAEEMCVNTGSAAECTIPTRQPVLTQDIWGIGWDVVADRPGSYVLRAEIVETTPPPDPNPSDNSASATVILTEDLEMDTGFVTTSSVRLTPSRPRAGSVVAATVRVTASDGQVRPTRIACAGTIAGAKIKGTPRAAVGAATCTYRTPRSARGKRLRGGVSFTARGARYTERFSTRLR